MQTLLQGTGRTGRGRARLSVHAAVAGPHAGWRKLAFTAMALAAALLLLARFPLAGQERRPLIDVEHYEIDARILFPTQSLEATAKVRFIPREETNKVIFELHNGLNVTQVVDENEREYEPVRYRQDSTVHVIFPDTLPAGAPFTLSFTYDGALTGTENSPVQGYDFASIQSDRAVLLYPGRWFPVNGFAADGFAATMNITAPAGMMVVGSGLGSSSPVERGVRHSFDFRQASFPGSIAVVPGEPLQVESNGVTTDVYFFTAPPELAQAYGEAVGEMISFFTSKFGPPYASSLAVVEAAEYGPNGYAAPGLVFLSRYGIRQDVNRRLLGKQVAHQWWGQMVSRGNRNHSWLDHGLAWYSALMEIEASKGEEAFNEQVNETRIESLTYDEIPLIQAGRLGEFSTEFTALAGAKGAMVLHMLRWVTGDDAFFAGLRQLAENFAWKSVITDDLRQVMEQASGKTLSPFFIQWTESTGTPEFSQEYTIYRLGEGKGFRVLGKVRQDMDTFQMPIELKIETEGEPEFEVIDVAGTSSDYTLDTFGKPVEVVLDPNNRILRFDDKIRVLVAIRKGEQLVELGYYPEALQEYQKALDINRYSSLAHYRIGEVFFLQNNYQSAANEFREALNGDREPPWTEVWSHINLGKIFDITGQRERAVNEYQLAIRTRDNTQGAQDEARKYLQEPYRRPRRSERIY